MEWTNLSDTADKVDISPSTARKTRAGYSKSLGGGGVTVMVPLTSCTVLRCFSLVSFSLLCHQVECVWSE